MGRNIIDNPTGCALTRAMNIIGSKWKPLIIYLIGTKNGNKPLRFGKINAILHYISKRVLVEQLKELEQDGLLIRKKFKEIPPRVEYSLSEKGMALLPVLDRICEWSDSEMKATDFG
ncbi:winged helix-turn-helix transcriptional regulator [Spongiimicrobium sp. 3-5]|uniref:winged helix-turn-helix transcriptional regulator n=1 Tax=Spongiimicrobium sp. 3-5 TaxID=3332596 RepID=UPI00397F0713